MAAKDILCGNVNSAAKMEDLKGLVNLDKTTGDKVYFKIDTKDDDIKDVKTIDSKHKFCKEVKWVGAPDKTDDLTDKVGSWGRDVCGGDAPAMGMVMPFIWYFVFYLGLLSYLIFNIWSLKEELAGAPVADTEMGKKPAVAVATATATAAA